MVDEQRGKKGAGEQGGIVWTDKGIEITPLPADPKAKYFSKMIDIYRGILMGKYFTIKDILEDIAKIEDD